MTPFEYLVHVGFVPVPVYWCEWFKRWHWVCPQCLSDQWTLGHHGQDYRNDHNMGSPVAWMQRLGNGERIGRKSFEADICTVCGLDVIPVYTDDTVGGSPGDDVV